MSEKVVRDGKVAVLLSPGYGAGWSTWADHKEAAVFAPEVVAWVEAGKPREAYLENEERWGTEFGYLGGMDDLEIEWLPVGTRFEIEEYDGSESLRILTPTDGYVA